VHKHIRCCVLLMADLLNVTCVAFNHNIELLPAMGNLVSGSAKRPGNPIHAAKIPIVRDNDVAIGKGARSTYRKTQRGHGSSTSCH